MPYFFHFVDKVYDVDPTSTLKRLSLERAQSLPVMPRQVKSGYLLHYKKRLFGKDWREMFVVLYEDSSLVWFRDRGAKRAEGSLRLLDSPDLIAAGQFVCRVPSAPTLPPGCCNNLAIAISNSISSKAQWFLTNSQLELIDWMKAINSTLPPPPPPPSEEWNVSKQSFQSLTPQNKISDDEKAQLDSLSRSQTNPAGHMMSHQLMNPQNQLMNSHNQQTMQHNGIRDRPEDYKHFHNLEGTDLRIQENPLRRSSLSSPCLYSRQYSQPSMTSEQFNQPSTRDLRTVGGEEMMVIAGLSTGWGTGSGWLHNYNYCSSCAMMEFSVLPSTMSHHSHGYDDDEPDCDTGDTDVGADFGDFGF